MVDFRDIRNRALKIIEGHKGSSPEWPALNAPRRKGNWDFQKDIARTPPPRQSSSATEVSIKPEIFVVQSGEKAAVRLVMHTEDLKRRFGLVNFGEICGELSQYAKKHNMIMSSSEKRLQFCLRGSVSETQEMRQKLVELHSLLPGNV